MKLLSLLMLPVMFFALSTNIEACPACEGETGTMGDDAKKADAEKPKSDDKGDSVESKEEEKAPEVATIDKKAPDFTLKNAKGDEVTLSSYKDKIVILEWANFDCPIVKKHYKDETMQKLAKSYREEGIVWLQICSNKEGSQGHFTGEDLTNRIEKESCDAAFYLIDTDGKVGTAYKARTTPHMYVIDKEGVLRYQGAIDSSKNGSPVGEDGTNYVKEAVDALKAGKEVATKETKPYGCSVKYADISSTGKRKGSN